MEYIDLLEIKHVYNVFFVYCNEQLQIDAGQDIL